MILTPLSPEQLAQAVAAFELNLPSTGPAVAVFQRIVASRNYPNNPDAHHADAIDLTKSFAMRPIAEAPQAAFSWDGVQVRTGSESAVLIHEVAHYQLASPARRFLPDFGLGAGPETGRITQADAAQRLTGEHREFEEQMASLLGVLWEVELGHPGIDAFLEQNWLEGAERPGAAIYLGITLDRLYRLGLTDDEGRPVHTVRIAPDPFR